VFADPFPTCENCGVPIRDRDKHQRFHDLIGSIYQQAFGLSAEDYERYTGTSAAERDARIRAASEAMQGGGAEQSPGVSE
jgi:hypothetical protein